MLSAQKHQMPSNTQPESSHPPKGTGFGKVLNSIQGLQQRLDDFSVEDVSRAHSTALSLIHELTHLPGQLNALVKLKNVVFIVNTQVEAIPEHDFDVIAPDSLDKHPQLRAIVQAGKLIRMHRMLRAAQAGANATSIDLQSTLPGCELSTAQVETVGHAVPDSIEPVLPPSPVTSTQVAAAPENDRVRSEAHQRTVLANSPEADDSKAKPIYDFSALKLDQARETASRRQSDSQPGPDQKQTPSRKGNKPKGKPQIDQRLLNELIETYGEFAISTKTAAPAKPEDVEPIAFKEPTATSTDVVATQDMPPEPAFVFSSVNSNPVEAPPSKQEGKGAVLEGPSPNVKSQGEIDRQLKSIIKDYGEYDLYSDQKSISAKTVLIAMIVALALALGGFYVFSTHSSSKPPAIEAASPSPEADKQTESTQIQK